MANEILVKSKTALVFKNTGGDAAITLASLASTAARQSAKIDLGATRAARYAVTVAIESGSSTPGAGLLMEFYWSASPNATAGSENDGGASGTDAAYKASEEDEWIKQLVFIGALVATGDANTIQQQTFIFSPPHRYGCLIVKNRIGVALSANNNHQITFVPIADEIQ